MSQSIINLDDIDVVILGAGINGAGLFRDLSVQGVNCIIVDKGDFGSGTSAAPSRLIHGGLKYLETGEFGLVAQSTLERNLLLKNAPHYVSPLLTIIPIFSWSKGIWAALRTFVGSTTAPRSRGAILIKIGLMIYDYFGSKNQMMPRHKLFSRKKSLQNIPELTQLIVATGTYYDAKISHPERLVLELITDAVQANPNSIAHNYMRLVSSEGGQLTFEMENQQAKMIVKPKIVVNAAGPWIDEVNEQLGETTKFIGGTKGSHILLAHDELLKSLAGRMIYFEADDGRVCLLFDFLGRVLVGSTDIPVDSPEGVHCEQHEVDYLLKSVGTLFPKMDFNPQQIVYAYSGVRPLPMSDVSNPGLISRDHSAPMIEANENRPFPIISLVGGKWTTFRGFAEEVSSDILKRLNKPRAISTKLMAIGGGKDFPIDAAQRIKWTEQYSQKTGITAKRIDQLLSRYGTKATQIMQHQCVWDDAKYLPDATDFSFQELDYIVQNEYVEHVEDLVMRRTSLAIMGNLTLNDLEQTAAIIGRVKKWDTQRTDQEIQLTKDRLRNKNLMQL